MRNFQPGALVLNYLHWSNPLCTFSWPAMVMGPLAMGSSFHPVQPEPPLHCSMVNWSLLTQVMHQQPSYNTATNSVTHTCLSHTSPSELMPKSISTAAQVPELVSISVLQAFLICVTLISSPGAQRKWSAMLPLVSNSQDMSRLQSHRLHPCG